MISIVIPVYNAEKTLEKCIKSIITQSFQEWELLLIDDGALDNSGHICDSFMKKDTRIKAFHKKNGGLSSARNYGIEHASANSRYICFCDSDDTIDQDYIKELYEGIANAEVSICRMNDIYEDDLNLSDINKYNSTLFTNILNNKNWYQIWECGVVNSSCNKLYSLDIIRKYNLRFKKIPMLEDMEFNSRYLQYVNNVYYTEKRLYNYWHTPGSLTTRVHEEDYTNYIQLHEYLLSWIPEQFHVYIHRFVYHQYFGITLKYIKLGIYDIPRKYLSNNHVEQAFDAYIPSCKVNRVQHWLVRRQLLRLYRLIFVTIYGNVYPH